MFYYIHTNAWNLLESFVSESISPFSFYRARGYGNNLSRYIDRISERANYLILSTEEIQGDYVLKVSDDILDKSCIIPVKKRKTVFSYGKTIFYKKGAVNFLFSSNDLIESLVAESQILFEVKCVEKYKSEFIVRSGSSILLNTDNIDNGISFQLQEYVTQDDIYDKLKGMIVAYTHAMAFKTNSQEQQLLRRLRDLKNSFAGLHTQIMISKDAVSNEGSYISRIDEAKEIYSHNIETRTNLFDILTQHFAEIVKMAQNRAEEIVENKLPVTKKRVKAQKLSLRRELDDIECRDDTLRSLKEELKSIKERERINGERLGKKREYFKEGTPEYKRKQIIKQKIEKSEEENPQIRSIKQEISKLRQRMRDIEAGTSQYDTTLGAMFVRVSGIMNELITNANASSRINSKVDYSCLSLSNLTMDIDTDAPLEEQRFLNIIINEALTYEQRTLSDDAILDLIAKSANIFKCEKSATTEIGRQILSTLREFWAYKRNQSSSFSTPENLIVLRSLMVFFIKPLGFDQMERYIQNKGIEGKEYGFMLRGMLVGYAALPKTFTNTLYDHKEIYTPMDEFLDVVHKQIEEQYTCK